MNDRQFELVARLIRARPGAVLDAARAVLVEGSGPTAAARRFGVATAQQVSNTVRRIRQVDADIRAMYQQEGGDVE